MAWNEPGGGKDPWGGNDGGGPPDLDEALKKLREQLGGIFGSGGGGPGGGNKPSPLLVVLMVFFILTGFSFLRGDANWFFGFYQVNAKERAVVLRLGKYLATEDSGLRWNPPLVDMVTKVRVTEERQHYTKGVMLTEDENIVELPLTVQYNVSDAKAFVLSVKNPEISLKHATDSALRHVVGSSKLDDVVSTGRQRIGDEVKEKLQSYLDIYGTGLNVVKINIQEASPPVEVKAAYDDVIKAREDRERLVNEAQAYANGIVPEARGRAQRVLQEADGYRAQVIAEAEGEAQRFEKLLAEYKKAPGVTRERLYLDAMQKVMQNSSKVLMDVEGGNNMMYLPLDRLVQQQPGPLAEGKTVLNSNQINDIASHVLERLRADAEQNRRRGVR